MFRHTRSRRICGLSCTCCRLSSLIAVRAKCRPLGLSRSPLTPRGCTPINSALLASACTEVFPPGSPSRRPLPLHTHTGHTGAAAGRWPLVSVHSQGRGAGQGLSIPAHCQHPVAPPAQTPLLSCSRASGSRWSRPGSRRSCTRARSPPRTRTPWKRPSRRRWRWPTGCTRRGLLSWVSCQRGVLRLHSHLPFAAGSRCSFSATECPCVVATCNSRDGIVYTALSVTLLVRKVLLQFIFRIKN